MACRMGRAAHFGSQYLPGSDATTSVPAGQDSPAEIRVLASGACRGDLVCALTLADLTWFPGPSQLFWHLLVSPTPPVLTPASYVAPQLVTCCCHPHTLCMPFHTPTTPENMSPFPPHRTFQPDVCVFGVTVTASATLLLCYFLSLFCRARKDRIKRKKRGETVKSFQKGDDMVRVIIEERPLWAKEGAGGQGGGCLLCPGKKRQWQCLWMERRGCSHPLTTHECVVVPVHRARVSRAGPLAAAGIQQRTSHAKSLPCWARTSV